jgi:hypothetical protein
MQPPQPFATPLPTLLLLLLPLAASHALLHMVYIGTWRSGHTQAVLRMSGAASAAERAAMAGPGARAWFWLGTGADIAAHLLLAAALLGRLLAAGGCCCCGSGW